MVSLEQYLFFEVKRTESLNMSGHSTLTVSPDFGERLTLKVLESNTPEIGVADWQRDGMQVLSLQAIVTSLPSVKGL
jgi:hypothetical protein